MKKQRIVSFVLICLAVSFLSSQLTYSQTAAKIITAKSIWNPDMAVMEKLSENCGSYTGTDLKNCFIKVMQESGASQQALEFTAQMNNDAYMNGFKNLGSVDAAFVYYPLRGNNHEGCLIVNGNPGLINIDDFSLLPLNDLESDKGYMELIKTYTNVALFPDERKNTVYPYNIELPKKENRVVVNYGLKNGCSTCELLGFAEFGFDFDSTGNFLGCKFLSLKKTVDTGEQAATGGYSTNYYSDPSQPVEVRTGDKFSIVLISNHSAGFKWNMAAPLDNQIVSLTGTDFVRPVETLPNAPGKEVWYFKAAGRGTTKIEFNYVQSFGEGLKSFEKYSFTVNVK